MTDIPDRLKRRAKIEAWLVDWFAREIEDEDGHGWYHFRGDDDFGRLADALEREIEAVLK